MWSLSLVSSFHEAQRKHLFRKKCTLEPPKKFPGDIGIFPTHPVLLSRRSSSIYNQDMRALKGHQYCHPVIFTVTDTFVQQSKGRITFPASGWSSNAGQDNVCTRYQLLLANEHKLAILRVRRQPQPLCTQERPPMVPVSGS